MKYTVKLMKRRPGYQLETWSGFLELTKENVVSLTPKEQSEDLAEVVFDIEKAINANTVLRAHIWELE